MRCGTCKQEAVYNPALRGWECPVGHGFQMLSDLEVATRSGRWILFRNALGGTAT